MIDISKKLSRVWIRLTAAFYFGFVRGHHYLSAEQISRLENVLKKGEDEIILQEYEQRFSSLIGSGQGKGFLAGRMAFYSLLKVLNIGPGDEVILPAFTCAVMPNAIWRSGATPIFTDIDPQTFGSDPDEIKSKITSRTKMIVAQHSFGIPCRIEEIVTIARDKGVFILEDSALALDSSRDGIKVGNWGDAAIFSTDHTKPLNTLIGGFLYTQDRQLFDKIKEFSRTLPVLNSSHQHRLYGQLLFEREYCVPQKYGRSFLNKLKQKESVFLESDYGRDISQEQDYPYPAQMPAFLAQLGLFELDRWQEEKIHRQEVLEGYIQLLDEQGGKKFIPSGYLDQRNDIVPLRFAFSFPHADAIRKSLRSFLDVDQIWFQSTVIGCPDGPVSLGYQDGSCPNAERVAREIINWPCVFSKGSKQVFMDHLRANLSKDLDA